MKDLDRKLDRTITIIAVIMLLAMAYKAVNCCIFEGVVK